MNGLEAMNAWKRSKSLCWTNFANNTSGCIRISDNRISVRTSNWSVSRAPRVYHVLGWCYCYSHCSIYRRPTWSPYRNRDRLFNYALRSGNGVYWLPYCYIHCGTVFAWFRSRNCSGEWPTHTAFWNPFLNYRFQLTRQIGMLSFVALGISPPTAQSSIHDDL